MDTVIHKVIIFCCTINEIIDDVYIIVMMITILKTCMHKNYKEVQVTNVTQCCFCQCSSITGGWLDFHFDERKGIPFSTKTY